MGILLHSCARATHSSHITLAGLVLFVSLFVCHTCGITPVNDGNCAHDFAFKALLYRNNLIPLVRGWLVVVHPCSAFSICCQSGHHKMPKSKMAEFGAFCRLNATDYRSSRNLARKRRQWICTNIPNLALIIKGSWVQAL